MIGGVAPIRDGQPPLNWECTFIATIRSCASSEQFEMQHRLGLETQSSDRQTGNLRLAWHSL